MFFVYQRINVSMLNSPFLTHIFSISTLMIMKVDYSVHNFEISKTKSNEYICNKTAYPMPSLLEV